MTVLNDLDRFPLVMDTLVVDALRTFMLAGSTSTFGLSHDYAVILVTAGTDPITRKSAGRDSPFGRTKSGQAHLQVRGKLATLRRGVHTNHSPACGGIVAGNLSRFDEECELFGPALALAALLAPTDVSVQGMYMGCTRDVHVLDHCASGVHLMYINCTRLSAPKKQLRPGPALHPALPRPTPPLSLPLGRWAVLPQAAAAARAR